MREIEAVSTGTRFRVRPSMVSPGIVPPAQVPQVIVPRGIVPRGIVPVGPLRSVRINHRFHSLFLTASFFQFPDAILERFAEILFLRIAVEKVKVRNEHHQDQSQDGDDDRKTNEANR